MPDSGGAGLATISISDPVVDHLIVAGSGTMSSDRLSAPAVGVTIMVGTDRHRNHFRDRISTSNCSDRGM
jgi:hypothetical protein